MSSWHDRRRPGIVWWVAAWLAILGLLLALIGSHLDLSATSAPAASTSGLVISKEPSDHDLVRAEFSVGGIRYVAADSFIGTPNRAFDDVQVGDTVTVFYDPAEPERARLHQQEPLSIGLVLFGVVAMLMVPTLFIAFLYLAFRSRALWFRRAGSRSA
jgi:hypothetical protein